MAQPTSASDHRDDDPLFASPNSGESTKELQEAAIRESPASERDTVKDDIVMLPVTGGPDGGDIEVAESKLDLSGGSIQSDPKSGSES